MVDTRRGYQPLIRNALGAVRFRRCSSRSRDPRGGGKSTALSALAARLRDHGFEVLTTREPGAGSFGRQIREILLHGEELDPKAELLLFLADRANHVASIIRPALAEGNVVLCDRYADSTVVYQAYSRGLDESFTREGNRFATGGLMPDLTLLFDLEPEEGLRRLQAKDRLDSQPIEFHRKVREGFLREAADDPLRWRVIPASESPELVFEQCWSMVWHLVSGTKEGA
jgi:dTMP kinase